MKVYDENSAELVNELETQRKKEIKYQNYPEESNPTPIYKESTKYLIKLIYDEKIINDKETSEYLYSINQRLAENNPNVRKIKKILIKKDGLLNATSYGEGTISINIGLIANAKSEDELAYVMAHEIAHFHLNHLRRRIESHFNKNASKQVKRNLKKIPDGTLTLDDLEAVQTWYNTLFKNSRENELEADSLAILMTKNSGYSFNAGMQALKDLKFVYQPIYPLKNSLFDEFIFEEMPFKKRWLASKKVTANGSLLLEHLVNNDSLTTHPDIDIRLDSLLRFTYSENADPEKIPTHINRKSKLELVETFYSNQFHDLGIHTSLQLKNSESLTSYLNFQIARMLYEIALAKNDKRLPAYVLRDNSIYPNESKALNNFFYNMTTSEAAELSYLFTKKNFDPYNPDQYSVLYKILLFTNRPTEGKELRKEFKEMFPKKNINKYLKTN